MSSQPRSSRRTSVSIREAVAIVVWIYALIKVLVFDLDAYVLGRLAPGSLWILNLRIIAIALVLAVLWVALGHRQFLLSVAYVAAYPLIILLWKLPKLIWRKWAVFLILVPSLYTAAVSFRSTFVLYTLAALSAVLIALGTSVPILAPAMLYLVVFLLVSLYRAFMRAHSSSVFSQLATIVRKLIPKILSGEYDEAPTTTPAATAQPAGTQLEPQAQTKPVPMLYMFHLGADFVAEKVGNVAKERKYNVLVITSFFYLVLSTVVVFALLYWALYKIDPSTFTSVQRQGFLQFFIFSLAQLASANLTPMQPWSAAAMILAALEVLTGLLILVIGGYSLLSAARDSYKEDFHDFANSLHETVAAIDNRIVTKYSLSAEQLEMKIASESASVVNFLRRLRGLPDLPAKETHEEKPPATLPPAQDLDK